MFIVLIGIKADKNTPVLGAFTEKFYCLFTVSLACTNTEQADNDYKSCRSRRESQFAERFRSFFAASTAAMSRQDE